MMETMTHPALKRYEEAFEMYTDVASRVQLGLIETMLFESKFAGAENLLEQFKTEDQLLFELEEKLNGKPIYSTLKKVRRGTVESKAQLLKGLFSLGTHAMIEVEKGNTVYSYIARRIHEKIGKLL
jgi:hypothetical protein